MTDKEQRVREHAYHLWEAAGRPHHREGEFWQQAEREIATITDLIKPATSPRKPSKMPNKVKSPSIPKPPVAAKASKSAKPATTDARSRPA